MTWTNLREPSQQRQRVSGSIPIRPQNCTPDEFQTALAFLKPIYRYKRFLAHQETRRCVRLTHFAKRKSFLANRKCHPRHQYLWRRRQWPGSIGGHGSARGHGCRPAIPKLFLNSTVILGLMHFELGLACVGIAHSGYPG